MHRTPRRLSRRELLWLASMGVGALGLASCGQAAATRQPATPTSAPAGSVSPPAAPASPSGTPARRPVAPTGRVQDLTLEAGPVTIDIGGQRVTTWGYNGQVPGPEIRVRQGDTLRATVRNRLPRDTTIHWHGLPIVNRMDGVPGVTQPPIKPGEDFVYEFVVPTAGTYMYHTHVGLQLDRGLFGSLIVEDPDEPLRYDREYALVFDDWLDGTPEEAMQRLRANGDRMPGMGGMGGGMSGGMGGMPGMGGADLNTPPRPWPPDLVYPRYLVNGRPGSAPLELVVKQGERVRLRLINPSSATIYRVALAGHRLTVTHADGMPVEPVEVDAVRIGMGERYDVLVTANNPGVWQLAAQAEGTSALARALVRYAGSTAAPPPADALPPEVSRQLLTFGMLAAAPGLTAPPRGAPDQVIPVQLSGGMGRYVWTINGQTFPAADPIAVGRDRHIRFQFQNMSMMPHPMHLHGHFFQVDTGAGRGPLKDTVLVEPMQQLAIDWVADNPGAWAFHCHNLYHMEAGMMRVVQVG